MDEKREKDVYSLEECAHDILSAIKRNDPYMLADALKEAFQHMEDSDEEKPRPFTYEWSKKD